MYIIGINYMILFEITTYEKIMICIVRVDGVTRNIQAWRAKDWEVNLPSCTMKLIFFIYVKSTTKKFLLLRMKDKKHAKNEESHLISLANSWSCDFDIDVRSSSTAIEVSALKSVKKKWRLMIKGKQIFMFNYTIYLFLIDIEVFFY